MNLTARGTHKLQGLNPYTKTFHETAVISNICNFGWYEWCYYREDSRSSSHKFPKALDKLGRCLDRVRITIMRCVSGYCVVSSGIVKPCRTIVGIRENV
jgi:hypothetical protein